MQFCNTFVRLAAASLLLLSATAATAASPELRLITPRGCQRGAEHELAFTGARLADAQEIFFYDKGFEVVKLEANGANQVKAVVKVAPDCRIGEHVAQVRTATGISEYRTFYVGALPAVDEAEPNSEFETPQAIALNVTVQGVIQSEDVDYFVIEAKKGQRIAVEVEGMRLGTTLFDPYVAILDEKRFELAAVDDTSLALQDPAVAVIAPADGKYVVEVRDSAYGGNGNCHYRAHIGTFPRPTAVFPAGGKVGEEIDVRFLGDPTGEIAGHAKLPAEPDAEFGLLAEDAGGLAPSPNPFRLFQHGNAFEAEPNNDFATATAAQLPLAFNGIIETGGDVDCFKFAAKKGEVYEVECYARRIRSELDPVMNIYHADGRGIAGNDDSRGPDSYMRFSVPDDGEYIVRVTDHLQRGGADFVYRIEFSPVAPQLSLGIPRVARYSQYRQTIFVPRGNRFATLISATRANFGGEIVLEGNDLPAGVTMICEPMAANLNVMPVVFEAAADAPIDGQLVEFTGRHADPNQNVRGEFENRADFVISAPGQSLYRWRDVSQLPIAVVDELPFKLHIEQPKAPLVREGSMQLKVVAERKEGFTAPINVQLPFRPPGVSAASSVNIPEGQNEVLYPLNANGNAEIKKWPIYAIGSANVEGNAWAASQLASLEIAAPYVTFEMARTSCEQGQETQVFCKVNHAAPFEGAAKVQLLGLPARVTTEDLEITKDTQELVFKVKTDPASPEGKHKNIFCQVTVMHEGEPVVARAGATELQIDKPLPPPPNQPAPTPMPAAVAQAEPPKAAPPAKPLSRLEKLRLAAKERAEAQEAAGGP